MASRSARIVEICSGYGGLGIALDVALGGARVVCHVEREAHAAAILAARMEDGGISQAPIWSDLATFDGRPWRGCVDIVAAGLPCQPYSLAGKRAGHADERAIWPDFCRVVEEVQPGAIFIENVPAFLALFEPIALRLGWLGYRVETPLVIGADDVGASHRRRRIFILAHALRSQRDIGGPVTTLCSQSESRIRSCDGSTAVANPDGLRGSQSQGGQPDEWGRSLNGGEELGIFAPGPSDSGWADILGRHPDVAPAIESHLRGVAYGHSSRVDRLRAVGNGVVPLQAAIAFRILADRAFNRS